MTEPMAALICVAEVPASVITNILTTSYAYGATLSSDPALLLLRKPAELRRRLPGPTIPPVQDIRSYPFLSETPEALAQLLRGTAPDAISKLVFLVADEQTVEDETLLLVGVSDEDAPLQTVRVSAEQANVVAVACMVAAMHVREVVANADSDGVFRGGSGVAAPATGGFAPPMRLGGA